MPWNPGLKTVPGEVIDKLSRLEKAGRLFVSHEATSPSDKSEYLRYQMTWLPYLAEIYNRAVDGGAVAERFRPDGQGKYYTEVVDNGKGLLPPCLCGTSERPLEDFHEFFEHQYHNPPNWQGSRYDGITLWVLRRMNEIIDLEKVARSLSSSSSGYARIGVLCGDLRQVRWVSGLFRDGTHYDCQDDASVSAVVDASMSHPSSAYRLADIPIERFIDLCDSLTDARRKFGQEVVRWASTIDAIESPEERRRKLREIRRDEIVPAMHEFNADTRTDLKKIIGVVEGASIAALALGGFAAALCGYYHVPIDGPAVAAATAAGLTVAANAGKGILDRKQETRQTWMAFASALSDEVDRLGPMQ